MFRLIIFASFCVSVLQLTVADCTDADTGIIYKTGQSWQPIGECNSRACHANGGYTATGCPLSQPPKEYRMSEENPTLGYPECCPKPVPDKDDIDKVLEEISGKIPSL